DLDYPEQRLRALGEIEGFPVLNLLYDFQQYAEQHHAHLHGFSNTKLGAGHWNEQGHELAAQLISKRICQDPSIL
ncbi:MAG: SGNH/GDSL hydrolase family protein, partial [Nitrospirales bacterium]